MTYQYVATLIFWLAINTWGASQRVPAPVASLAPTVSYAAEIAGPTNRHHFELKRRLIYVQAAIAGQKGNFLVDTGAPHLILNRKPKRPTIQGVGSGNTVPVGEVITTDFCWGPQRTPSLMVLLVDLSHFEKATGESLLGIIGFDQLQDWDVVFDYQNRQLLFYEDGTNPLYHARQPMANFSFSFAGHLPIIRLSIGRETFDFVLDTGAAGNIIDPAAFGRLSKERIVEEVQHEVQGLDQTVQRVAHYTLDGIRLGNHSLEPLSFSKLSMEHLRAVAEQPLDGILGYPFLSRFLFSIDYPRQRVVFWE